MLPLAADFPAPSRDEWMSLVEKVLKGADFHKKLVSRTADGIEVQPLYVRGDAPPDAAGFPGSDPFTRGAGATPRDDGRWDVAVSVDHPDVATANRIALDELLRGASSLLLHLGDDGVKVNSADELDRLLEGVHLEMLPVVVAPHTDAARHAEWLRAVWSRRGLAGDAVSGSLGFDPLGTGDPDGLAAASAAAVSCAADHPRVRAFVVDAGRYVDAGATPAQQLAAMLATGAAYLRAMDAEGLDPTTAASQIEVHLSLDADFFGGITLCRAARRVWAAMLAECGVAADGRGLRLHVSTAARMMTRRDPWVNLLRVTSATFASALGGADSILARSFDSELGVPDEFGRRLARNTHLLLQEESNVGRVLDPAGGSWYVETLTEQLAHVAWELFAGIEADGAMAAVLADGSWAAKIDGAWRAREGALATRRVPVTGVSEFPLIDEEPLQRPQRSGAAAPQVRHRDAEAFEALRDRAAASDPTIFLANLGSIATHTARATWAKNFFEAGGVRALTNDGFADAAAAASAFESSGARIACLCSSDAVYADLAESTAAALKAAGAERVYLAGNPGDARGAYEAAGVDEFVHVGVDVVGSLSSALDLLEATR